jgi:hypothetical protein
MRERIAAKAPEHRFERWRGEKREAQGYLISTNDERIAICSIDSNALRISQGRAGGPVGVAEGRTLWNWRRYAPMMCFRLRPSQGEHLAQRLLFLLARG